MIKTVVADGKAEFDALDWLAARGGEQEAEVEQTVRRIIDDVRVEGDAAVVRYTQRFDGPDAAPGGRIMSLEREDLKEAFESLDSPLADALLHAAENILAYHKKQAGALKGYEENFPDEAGGAEADARYGYEYDDADEGDDDGISYKPWGAVYGDEEDEGNEPKDAGGVIIGQIVRGLERVGVYVPGGRAAYPSTVLMNVIPARLAGVGEIVMVTPPRKVIDEWDIVHESDRAHWLGSQRGNERNERALVDFGTDAAILGAAYIAGVDRVILAGGGQAVAALAYGTETIPRVDKIVGPGNVYVATAKRLLYGVVDIDMVAGPSEILIMADETANAAFVAADLLSQAEHDPDAASILLTTSAELAAEAAAHVWLQLEALRAADASSNPPFGFATSHTSTMPNAFANASANAHTARQSLAQNGLVIICRSEDEMVRLANEIAPEHLEIMTFDPLAVLTRIKNAGSVFLGPWTPEPVGDYYSGTNHVLPTNGTARFASPLGVYDFVKRMSYTRYTEAALLKAKDDIVELAYAEGLLAHAEAVKARFLEE